ncbi:hypothetical protein D3C86_1367720 [compost metagenome]
MAPGPLGAGPDGQHRLVAQPLGHAVEDDALGLAGAVQGLEPAINLQHRALCARADHGGLLDLFAGRRVGADDAHHLAHRLLHQAGGRQQVEVGVAFDHMGRQPLQHRALRHDAGGQAAEPDDPLARRQVDSARLDDQSQTFVVQPVPRLARLLHQLHRIDRLVAIDDHRRRIRARGDALALRPGRGRQDGQSRGDRQKAAHEISRPW